MTALRGVHVAVVGLGPMGRGIARAFAVAGATVTVLDATAELTASGVERIAAEATEAGETPDVEIAAAADIADAVRGAELLVEAIVERPAAKAELLTAVREAADERLIVASNTSSLSIGELGLAFGDASRVVGMHFFNPVARMALVEVVRGPRTASAVVDRARSLAQALGKTAIVCADAPNFVVNRVCRPLYYEAQLLATQGVAPAAVDAIARGALGHRMGPLELLDFTGLHTHLGSSETALREFGDPRYRPIPRTRALVRAGATGRAAGRGWYDYEREKPRDARARITRQHTTTGAGFALSGPGAGALVRRPSIAERVDSAAPVALYSAPASCTREDVAAVRRLIARGVGALVDSSHHGWIDALPAGASWIRLHAGRDRPFAEVVSDAEAAIMPGPAVDALLDALGGVAVEVPALPGLVADRLAHTLINEAVTVVEEGIATVDDVDLALRLGMNHPVGPLELLGQLGERTVLRSLRALADGFGDPRYRPAPLLMRRAAGAARRAAPGEVEPISAGELRLPT